MAQIAFEGRVIGEPELKFSQAGKPWMRFRTVENTRKNQDGEWKDTGAAWRDVTVFGARAESLAESLRDKQRVVVMGTLEAREWVTKEGEKRTDYAVIATAVGIVPERAQSGGTSSGGHQRGQSAGDPWATAGPSQQGGYNQPGGDSQPPF